MILISLVVISACDLLQTRDPETPNTGGTAFVTPTTPDILFQNLIIAFEDKILENYIACFVDEAFSGKEFRFIPSAGSISRFSDLANWDLNAERTYFNNLRAVPGEGEPITLTLSNELNNPLGDSAVYQFDYILQVPIADQNSVNDYRGSLLFRIYRDNRQQWVIGEWEDIKIEEFDSWSELKGRYY